MKKIIHFLPAMAILLASGLAIASHSTYNTPNVKWTGSGWESFSGNYYCDGDVQPCVGHMDSEGNVTTLEYGLFIPIP